MTMTSLLIRVLFSCVLTGAFATSLAAQCQRTWAPSPLPGANNKVVCVLEWDQDGAGPLPARLVAGGFFTTIGSTVARGIALFDDVTGQWAPLGSGVQGTVAALAVLPNGHLVVGGGFPIAGGSVASNLARWDGSAWSGIGGGTDGGVESLLVLPNGDLVVGGAFANAGGNSVNKVARWNGSTWSPFLTGIGIGGSVKSLTRMPNGDLVAAGTFGGCVSRWDGLGWSLLGGGFTGLAYCMRQLPGGQLLVGGSIYSINSIYMGNITRWDGTSWQPLDSGLNNFVDAVDVLPNGDLLAGGTFALAGPTLVSKVARWTGTAWTPMASGLNGLVEDFCIRGNGTVVAGGEFTPNGTSGGLRIAQWNGATWAAFGSGTDGDVKCRLVDAAGRLVVGGSFTRVASVGASRVARWDGTAWSPLPGLTHAVRDLAELPNGELLAAGQFQLSSTQSEMLMRWNGSAWSQFGAITNVSWGAAVVVMSNGDVVLGGTFTSVTGVAANRVARWNGSTWSALGSGLDGAVLSMAVAPNGDLIVGGDFLSAGGVSASRIARWDGIQWSAMGAGLPSVLAIEIAPNGDIYAAGSSLSASVARWTGTSWQTLGSGTNGWVQSMTFLPDGSLVIGGEFTMVSGVSVNRTARWNGSAWSAFLPVGNGAVQALAALPSGTVWAGGTFTTQPGGVLGYLASSDAPCPAQASGYGAGCTGAGGLLQTTAPLPPWLGTTFRATTTGLPTASIGVCVRGFTPMLQELWQLLPEGQPGCWLRVAPTVLDAYLPVGGVVTSSLVIPSSLALVGVSVVEQMVVFEIDPFGAIAHITSSNGILAIVGAL